MKRSGPSWLGVFLSKEEGLHRTFAFAYLATAVAQLCEVSYNYVLYRYFSVSDIGLLSWASALIVFFGVAVDLGVEPILIRRFSNSALSLPLALKATLLPRVPIILLGTAIATWLLELKLLTTVEYWALLLIGAQIAFTVADGVFRAWLRANGRQTITNVITAHLAALKLFAIVVLTSWSDGTLFHVLGGLLVIRALGTFAAFRIAFAVGSSTTESPPPVSLMRTTGSLLRAGVVIAAIGGLTAVQNRFDWLLVSRLVSTDALASYSLVNKLYEISQVIIGVAITTLYPRLCRDTSSQDPMYSYILRLLIIIGVAIATFGMILSPILIKTLFGNKYADIENPAHLLMLAVGFMAASGVFYNITLAKGLERYLLIVTIIATSTQVACNLWLIPRMGMNGAAISMLILLIVTTIGLAYIVHIKHLLTDTVLVRILLFLAIFPFAPALVIYNNLALWLALPLCLAAILLPAWWILFDPMERRRLRARLEQRTQYE